MFKVTGHWFWIWEKSSSPHLKHTNSPSRWWTIKCHPDHHILWDKNQNYISKGRQHPLCWVQSWGPHAALGKCLPSLGYISVPPASDRLYLNLLGWWAMILSGVFSQLTPASPGSLYAFPYAQGGGAVSMDTKEMKRALTLVCQPVSRVPLTPASHVLAWSVSLGLIISTPRMCLCGDWAHYRLHGIWSMTYYSAFPHLSPEPDITPISIPIMLLPSCRDFWEKGVLKINEQPSLYVAARRHLRPP